MRYSLRISKDIRLLLTLTEMNIRVSFSKWFSISKCFTIKLKLQIVQECLQDPRILSESWLPLFEDPTPKLWKIPSSWSQHWCHLYYESPYTYSRALLTLARHSNHGSTLYLANRSSGPAQMKIIYNFKRVNITMSNGKLSSSKFSFKTAVKTCTIVYWYSQTLRIAFFPWEKPGQKGKIYQKKT